MKAAIPKQSFALEGKLSFASNAASLPKQQFWENWMGFSAWLKYENKGLKPPPPGQTVYYSLTFRWSSVSVIFSQCATAHWCATNGQQVSCRHLREGHLLVGPLGDMSLPQVAQCALSIVKKLRVCPENFSKWSVCHEMKKVKKNTVLRSQRQSWTAVWWWY